MTENSNLVDCVEKLKPKHWAFLLRTLKARQALPDNAHMGMLPFVRHNVAKECLLSCLRDVNRSEVDQRCIKEILGHLGVDANTSNVTFRYFLNREKVVRALGYQGGTLRVPFMSRSTAGMKWQEFGGQWKPNPIETYQHIQMKNIKGNMWEITCAASIAQAVKEFLIEKHGG